MIFLLLSPPALRREWWLRWHGLHAPPTPMVYTSWPPLAHLHHPPQVFPGCTLRPGWAHSFPGTCPGLSWPPSMLFSLGLSWLTVTIQLGYLSLPVLDWDPWCHSWSRGCAPFDSTRHTWSCFSEVVFLRESSYTTAGNFNWYSHYGQPLWTV